LNYGTWQQIKWLISVYTWKEIKAIIKNPSRGIWTEQSLNYWTKFCKIRIPSKMYQRAIMQIEPKHVFKSH
jgi:hypothetical protein